MFKLLRMSPINGTYYESTYEEVVPVTDGVCFVTKDSTRDALLLRGFVDAPEEALAEEIKPIKGKWKTKGVETA